MQTTSLEVLADHGLLDPHPFRGSQKSRAPQVPEVFAEKSGKKKAYHHVFNPPEGDVECKKRHGTGNRDCSLSTMRSFLLSAEDISRGILSFQLIWKRPIYTSLHQSTSPEPPKRVGHACILQRFWFRL